MLTRSRMMSSLDPEMSERVALAMTDAGVEVVLDAEVTGFDVDDGEVVGVHWTGGSRACDLVVARARRAAVDRVPHGSGIPLGPDGRPESRTRVAG